MGNTFNHRGTETLRNALILTAEAQRRREENPIKFPLIPLLQRGKGTPHLNPLPHGEKRRGLWSLILVLSLALMVSACDKLRETLTAPTTEAAFYGSTPGSNSVYMEKNGLLSSVDTLAIDVKANSISGNAKGAAFDVDFDSTRITYSGYAEGNFFGSGSSINVALQSGSTNKVVVGVSTASGTVTGSGTIVTLKFKATGNSAVDFSNNELRDSGNQAVSGISWSGGTVTVQ